MKCRTSEKCHHPGCKEQAHWSFDSHKEMSDHFKKRQDWKCLRHSKPDSVLSTERTQVIHIMTATRLEGGLCPDDLFWYPEGIKYGSGFASGPGFMAYANDFPEGTKIKVTTELILPDLT